jgi:hypothetical protein
VKAIAALGAARDRRWGVVAADTAFIDSIGVMRMAEPVLAPPPGVPPSQAEGPPREYWSLTLFLRRRGHHAEVRLHDDGRARAQVSM